MLFLTMALFASQAKAEPAPTLTTPVTLGGTAGSSVTINLAGKNMKGATELYLGTLPLHAKFADVSAEKCTATFEVPKSLAVGLHALRLATKTGISNLRPFAVDDLKEVAAAEGRTKKEMAQVLAGPCVVVAAASIELSDFYKLQVKAKQRWTFEIVGHRLGSPIDPVLILHDAKTGRELPGLYADDTPGLQTDARLTHTFDRDVDVLIEVRDTTFRGGADYGYRLRIGDFANSIATFPLAAHAGKEGSIVGFVGDNFQPVILDGDVSLLLSPHFAHGPRGWGVSIKASEIPEFIEEEPNDEPKTAKIISIPFGISACFEKKNDRDCFAVQLKKGAKISIVAEAAEFALSTEVYLKLLDADGKEVAKSDPMKMPAAFDFDAPADGRYVIAAEHLNYGWGPNEVYHLVVQYREPDAFVSLGGDHLTLPGKLAVTGVTKMYGFDDPIELRWLGDEAIQIKSTIPAKTNPTAAAPFQITFEAKPGTKPGVYFGRITSQVKGRTAHTAATTELLKAAFTNLTVLPAEMNGIIAVVVKN